MKTSYLKMAALLWAVATAGCSPPIVKGISAGAWNMSTPTGKNLPVTVVGLDNEVTEDKFTQYQYHIRSAGQPFSGVYVFKGGNTLTMETPDDPRMFGYVFSKKSEAEIILSSEPSIEHAKVSLVPAVTRLAQ